MATRKRAGTIDAGPSEVIARGEVVGGDSPLAEAEAAMVAVAIPGAGGGKGGGRGKPKPPLAIRENYWRLFESYERSLLAQHRSAQTLRTYRAGCKDFAAFLAREGVSLHVEAITPAACQSYLVDALGPRELSPRSVVNYASAVKHFCSWMVDQGHLDVTPWARVKLPKVAKTPPQIMRDDQLTALLKVCRGRDFYARRDTALIRLLIDCGFRRGEAASMTLDTLDLARGLADISGKTGAHPIPFGPKTASALDAYLIVREVHPHAESRKLWLGRSGPLTDEGIYRIVKRRAEQAGLGPKWTHLFRHTFAHVWLDSGGQEGQLMEIMGWTSRAMVDVYAKSVARERALDAHKRMNLGDRV